MKTVTSVLFCFGLGLALLWLVVPFDTPVDNLLRGISAVYLIVPAIPELPKR